MKIDVEYKGEKFTVNPRPIDNIEYSNTARRRGWPTNPQEDIFTFGYYVAYAAMKRLGNIPAEMGFNEFLDGADAIELDSENSEPNPTETAN